MKSLHVATMLDMVIEFDRNLCVVVQISLNQPSCFPYAEVAVAVAQTHPGFAELMIARLHEVGLHAVNNTTKSVHSARSFSTTPVVGTAYHPHLVYRTMSADIPLSVA